MIRVLRDARSQPRHSRCCSRSSRCSPGSWLIAMTTRSANARRAPDVNPRRSRSPCRGSTAWGTHRPARAPRDTRRCSTSLGLVEPARRRGGRRTRNAPRRAPPARRSLRRVRQPQEMAATPGASRADAAHGPAPHGGGAGSASALPGDAAAIHAGGGWRHQQVRQHDCWSPTPLLLCSGRVAGAPPDCQDCWEFLALLCEPLLLVALVCSDCQPAPRRSHPCIWCVCVTAPPTLLFRGVAMPASGCMWCR